MARTKFEVVYPHRGCRIQRISCAERNSLLLSGQIKQIGPTRYKFIGQTKTYHSFADLAELLPLMTLPPNLIRRYLEMLCVIFERALERQRESEETPEGFYERLVAMGMPEDGFAGPPVLQMQT